MEGQGGSGMRLMNPTTITHIVTLLIPTVCLLTEPP